MNNFKLIFINMLKNCEWKILSFLCKKTNTNKLVNENILNLKNTLINGQAFSWHIFPNKSDQENQDKLSEIPLFHGVLNKYYIQFMKDNEGFIKYRAYPYEDELIKILDDYFQFDYDYEELIADWDKRDTYFSKISGSFKGLRILRQDPFECLVSFLCSQNNNIPRITKLLAELRKKYGNQILKEDSMEIYSFPTVDQLLLVKEQELREMGFGYRAKYIVESVKMIKDKGGNKWLQQLRGKDSKIVQEELCELTGIGKKVADCISLFSLDCKDVIPVDTHVFQIYEKIYKQKKVEKLNKNNYDDVSNFFKDKFGEYAGWAHSYLFTSDLSLFKEIMGDLKDNTKNESKKRKKPKDDTLEEESKISSKKVKTVKRK